MQQPHFEHVGDPQQHLGEIEGFADEILRPAAQRPQLAAGVGGDDQDREVAAGFQRRKLLHDLEPIQSWHVQVQKDQVVVVQAVQFADPGRFQGGTHRQIAGPAQHLLQQQNIGYLIVDDQDFALPDIRLIDHGDPPPQVLRPWRAARSSAASRTSMNEVTLMGLVM